MTLNLVPKMPIEKADNDETIRTLSTGLLLLKFWPIVLAFALGLLSVGGIYVKLDFIAESMKETKAQFAVVNDRQTLTSQSIIELRGTLNNVAMENARNGQAISNLNERVNVIADKARWTPK